MNYYSDDINDIDLWDITARLGQLHITGQKKGNQSFGTGQKNRNQLYNSQQKKGNQLLVTGQKKTNKKVKCLNPHVKLSFLVNTPVTINPHILGIIPNTVLCNTEFETVNEVLTYTYPAKNSKEYKRIKAIFESRHMIVKRIKEVHNPYLKKAFEMKKHFCYGNIKPKELFHGTKQKNVDSICTYNFNWRLSGSETGYRHGKGVNFAKDPLFAAFFGEKRMRKVVIIADVLIKNTAPGTENLFVPPKDSDTTTGKNGRICVKFYDNEFYPSYVVEFLHTIHNK